MDETTEYINYPYPGITTETNEVVLKTKLPYFFKEKSLVNFWGAEDLFDLYADNNDGSMEVDLYVLGKFLLTLKFGYHL